MDNEEVDYTVALNVSGIDILRGDGWWAVLDESPSGVTVYTSRKAAIEHASATTDLKIAQDFVDRARERRWNVRKSRIMGGRRAAEGFRAGVRHRERAKQ